MFVLYHWVYCMNDVQLVSVGSKAQFTTRCPSVCNLYLSLFTTVYTQRFLNLLNLLNLHTPLFKSVSRPNISPNNIIATHNATPTAR